MSTAAQQVAQALAAQYRPLDFAYGRQQASSRRQGALLTAAQAALVRQLQSGVRPAGRVYDQAVAQQQALAHAGQAALGAASPDAGIQRDLASIGAPANQRQNVAAQNARDFGGQGGVLYVDQGAVPGSSLVANKAAVQAFQAGLPAVAAAAGAQTLRSLVAQNAKVRDQYLADRMRIAGEAPGLLQQIHAAQAEAAYRQQRANAEDAYRAAEIALAQQRISQSRQSRQRTAAGRQSAAKGKRANVFYSTRSKAFKQAQALYNQSRASGGTAAGVGAQAGNALGLSGGGSSAARSLNVRQAQNVLWNTYSPVLLNAGYKRAAIRQMIRRALTTAGYAFPTPPQTIKPPPGAGITGAYGNTGPRANRPG